MEYQKLLSFIKPSSTEIAQRWAKILFNSCYDRVSASSDFDLYDVPVHRKRMRDHAIAKR